MLKGHDGPIFSHPAHYRLHPSTIRPIPPLTFYVFTFLRFTFHASRPRRAEAQSEGRSLSRFPTLPPLPLLPFTFYVLRFYVLRLTPSSRRSSDRRRITLPHSPAPPTLPPLHLLP